MFKFLDIYFLKEFFKIFLLLVFALLPVFYLLDFFIYEYSTDLFFKNILFKYGSCFSIIILFSAYCAILKILNSNEVIIFYTLYFKKYMALKILFFINIVLFSMYFFIIIPSNDKCFSRRVYISNWALLNDSKKFFFIYTKNHIVKDVWSFDLVEKKFIYLKPKESEIELNKELFYIIWNEPKKLSLDGLNEYEAYLRKNGFNSDLILKQRIMIYSKFFFFLMMLICGYGFGCKNYYFLWFFCCILSNCVDQIAFFFSLKYCIILVCSNILFWLFLGIGSVLF